MSVLVIDASVAIKWFFPEPHAINAIRLIDAGYDLIAPDLIFPECGNVLWKKWQRQEVVAEVISEVLKDLNGMNMEIVPSFNVINEASKIATTWRRSFYDSIYLALAVVNNGRMITGDEKLFNALQNTPMAGFVVSLANPELP